MVDGILTFMPIVCASQHDTLNIIHIYDLDHTLVITLIANTKVNTALEMPCQQDTKRGVLCVMIIILCRLCLMQLITLVKTACFCPLIFVAGCL